VVSGAHPLRVWDALAGAVEDAYLCDMVLARAEKERGVGGPSNKYSLCCLQVEWLQVVVPASTNFSWQGIVSCANKKV